MWFIQPAQLHPHSTSTTLPLYHRTELQNYVEDVIETMSRLCSDSLCVHLMKYQAVDTVSLIMHILTCKKTVEMA